MNHNIREKRSDKQLNIIINNLKYCCRIQQNRQHSLQYKQINNRMDLTEQQAIGENHSYHTNMNMNMNMTNMHNAYDQLAKQFASTGITYKSNQILHKVSLMKGYPYAFMIQIAKIFHMNQFEIIFLCHIASDEESSYQTDPAIFQTNMNLPDLMKIYNRLTKNGQNPIKIQKSHTKAPNQQQQQQQFDQRQQQPSYWSVKQLRKLYIFLLVLGYSVKYYLNQSIKPYQQHIKQKYPQFFTSIFNIWVDKYSNKVLRTNPRKINQFYMEMFQSQENSQIQNMDIDCQYRNYNQIVEEVIKATSDGDQGGHEDDRDFGDN